MKKLNDRLKSLHDRNEEHCGFVLRDKSVITLKNISSDPEQTFEFDPGDFSRYLEHAVASWHTHTHADPNLSFDDYQFFLSWPELGHFIISSNAVWYYEVVDGSVVVINEADDNTSRASAR